MSSLVRKSAAAAAGASLMAFALTALVPATGAQEPSPKAKSPKKADAKNSKAAAPDAAHRVPRYFGGLGLTAQQKEQIYGIADKYQPQIQELEKQLEVLRDRQMVECENVLTAAQRKALDEARKAAAGRRKADEDEAGEPAAAPKSKAPRKPATIE